MFIRKLPLLFILATLLWSLPSHSAEEKKEEGKKEESKEGGQEEKSSVAPWVELESKIQEQSARIKSKEANIEKLIEEKNKMANDSPELRNTMKDLLKEHAELKNLVEEYDKNVNQLKYRYPERNAKGERKYDRIEVKSIDEMEAAMTVDGKLTRNIQKMRSQYHPEAAAANKEKSTEAPAVKKTEKKEESIDKAGSVILQK